MKRTIKLQANDGENKIDITVKIDTGNLRLANYESEQYVGRIANSVHAALRNHFNVQQIKLS